MAKTLWMLERKVAVGFELVPLYAEDEAEARQKAIGWAERHEVEIDFPPSVRHFPHGLLIHRSLLSGIEETERGK